MKNIMKVYAAETYNACVTRVALTKILQVEHVPGDCCAPKWFVPIARNTDGLPFLKRGGRCAMEH